MWYLLGDNLESVVYQGISLESIGTTCLYGVCQFLRDSRTEQDVGFGWFQDLFTVSLSCLPCMMVSAWDISRGWRLLVSSSLVWSWWASMPEFTWDFHYKINSRNILFLRPYSVYGPEFNEEVTWPSGLPRSLSFIAPAPFIILSRFHPQRGLRGQPWPVTGHRYHSTAQTRNLGTLSPDFSLPSRI